MKSFSELARRFSRGVKGYGGVSGAMVALFIAVLVIFNMIIYALATRFSWYGYTAAHYEHQIGAASEAYFAPFADSDAEVKIRFCMAKDALEADTVYNLVHQTALQYAAAYDFITVDYINIYTDPDEVMQYKYRLNPETGKQEKINTIATTSVIIDGGESSMVQQMHSFFHLTTEGSTTAYNGEEVMAAMIHWVLTDEHQTVYFTRNHGEKSDAMFYNLLICAGYNVLDIDLAHEEIPSDAAMIVIANPLYDFEASAPGSGVTAELDRLHTYLEGGGMLYALLDPLVTGLNHLDAMLAEWGLTRQAATVRDAERALTPDGLTLLTEFPNSTPARAIRDRIHAYSGNSVVLKSAAPILLAQKTGYTAAPILASSSSAKAYAGGETVSSDGSYTLAALSENANGGRVFLVSSVFLTARDAIQTNGYANRDFLYALLETADGAEAPLGTSILPFDSDRLEGLAVGTVHRYALVLVLVLPLIAVGCGIVIRVRRKNR